MYARGVAAMKIDAGKYIYKRAMYAKYAVYAASALLLRGVLYTGIANELIYALPSVSNYLV